MSLNNTAVTASNGSLNDATGSTTFGLIVELFCVWTMCGNMIIILVLTLYKPLTIPDILVFSLALSDLLNVVFPAQLLNIIPNLLKTTWSESLCISMIWSAYLFRISSVLTVTVISLDRLIAVQKPLVYRSRVMHEITKVKMLILVLWLVSCFLATLPFIGFGHSGFHNGVCSYQLIDLGIGYGVLMEIIGILQLGIVLYCYIAIKVSTGNFMKRQDKFRHAQLSRAASSTPSVERGQEPRDGVDSTQAANMLSVRSSVSEQHRLRPARSWRRRQQGSKSKEANESRLTDGMKQVAKMEKLMATLVFLFYLSWLPFLVSNLVSLATGKTSETVVKLVGVCSLINGLLNPVVYATIYPRYKKGYLFVFKTILSLCGGKKPNITADDFDSSKRNRSRRLQTMKEVISNASMNSEDTNSTARRLRGWSHMSSPNTETIPEEEQKVVEIQGEATIVNSSATNAADLKTLMPFEETGSSAPEKVAKFTIDEPEMTLPGESYPDPRFISVSSESSDEIMFDNTQKNPAKDLPLVDCLTYEQPIGNHPSIFLRIGNENTGFQEF